MTDIIISDMSSCQPAAAVSDRRRLGHWQVLPYETAGFSGRMLLAGFMTDAPEVRLSVEHAGWFAIHLGLWLAGKTDTGWGKTTQGAENVGGIKVKLTDDPCFITLRREAPDRATLEEVFWKVAELRGQQIVFAQQIQGFTGDASIAYVRLVPLSESERQAHLAYSAAGDHRRLIATNDAFGVFLRNHITTAEGIWEQIEPYRNTDFGMLWWEIVSEMFGGWNEEGVTYAQDFPRPGDALVADSYRTMKTTGLNPLSTAIDYAHRIGIELHVSQRSEMFQTAPPFEECFTTAFYRDHPEWRLRDSDATQVTGMSYCFPQVRSYLIGLLERAVCLGTNGADGVVMIWPRSAPFILYEDPFLEAFSERHGTDCRELPEADKRVTELRAVFMTAYMTELRHALDRAGEKLGRRLALSSIVFATNEENCLAGLDLAAWIRGGLLDLVSPYPYSQSKQIMEIEMDYFRGLTAPTGCRLYPNVMPRHMPAADYRSKAAGYYAAGADGLLFWDTYQRHDASSQWQTIRGLGHRDQLRVAMQTEDGPAEPRLLPLLRLADHHMGRYSPYRGA